MVIVFLAIFFLLVVVSFLLVLVFPSFFIKKELVKDRSEALGPIANRLGFSFQENDEGLRKAFERTKFNKGDSYSLNNTITVKRGDVVADIFECKIIDEGDDSTTVYDQTVYRLCLPDSTIQFPEFLMEPYNCLDKIKKWFGGQFIEFDSFPEFSKMYRLRGQDEEAIRSLFNDDIIKLLLKRKEGLFLEVVSDSMFMFRLDHQARLTKESVQNYFRRYHSIGMAFKKALEESVSIQK